ncbi:MAG TPA: DUF5615 family PIN-like protein [Cytophagales bacterium]|nr:DUF5615 family PIN-like protein [Cytophagales bacterium]
MKLLFDQNISFRILNLIGDSFSGSKQVRELGLEDSSDAEIFEFARINDFSVVKNRQFNYKGNCSDFTSK